MVLHGEAQREKCESNERNDKAGTISRKSKVKRNLKKKKFFLVHRVIES